MMNKALPFTAVGTVAIVAGGVIGAAVAHRPTQSMVWLIAYLVLVVGVGQYALGAGQTLLGDKAPAILTVWGQWILLNLGHAGVIFGTLTGSFGLVAAATVPYVLAMVWFGLRVRRANGGAALFGYRLLALVLLVGSLTGVVLSLLRNSA